MCTAISFHSGNHYFGRNFDLEYHYKENIVVTPRHYPFTFRQAGHLSKHHAIIGAAIVSQGQPLYYDAMNEYGLCMAGLAFEGNAQYASPEKHPNEIAPFELIPWVLSNFCSVREALAIIQNTKIVAIPFSDQYPLSDLHWILCDKEKCCVIEALETGLHIYEAPIGVLTNNPPFQYQMTNLCNYMGLSSHAPTNHLAPDIPLSHYSRGMGSLGLPGDFSSASRFVRVAFTKSLSVRPDEPISAVSQFFHILDSVAQPEGCVSINKKYEKTIYSSCCDTSKKIYYYTTYDNRQITAVDLYNENLDESALCCYPMRFSENIYQENQKGTQ